MKQIKRIMSLVAPVLSLGLLLASSSVNAAGVDCSAQCIVIDSSAYQVHVLGKVNYAADLPPREAYGVLQRFCKRLVRDAGVSGAGILVDQVSFSAEKGSELIEESSGSYRYNGTIVRDSSGSFWISRSGRRHTSQYGTSASSVRVYSQDSYEWNTYTSSREDRSLSVSYEPASPKTSCELDESIEDGAIPYPGSLPLKG